MRPWRARATGASGAAGIIAPLPHPLVTPLPPALGPVVSELIDLLALERLEDNLFRGQSRDIGTKYVFGGQVLGQALAAAQATIGSDRHAHSLHAHFLRAGDIEHPIVYDVDRTRDGGSFSVRRVTAIQHGKVIFFCAASFQDDEPGAEHQLGMPEVPRPEDIAPAPPVPVIPRTGVRRPAAPSRIARRRDSGASPFSSTVIRRARNRRLPPASLSMSLPAAWSGSGGRSAKTSVQ